MNINPRRLAGPWDAGGALDFHSKGSVYVGDDEFGHPRFETTRSEIGELLFELKYRGVFANVKPLAQACADFLRVQGWPVDKIIPVPPSKWRRQQPVELVAAEIGAQLGIAVCTNCLRRVGSSVEAKNRQAGDNGPRGSAPTFTVDPRGTEGMRLLLFDDLYGSGMTTRAISGVLRTEGHAAAIYLLTVTAKANSA